MAELGTAIVPDGLPFVSERVAVCQDVLAKSNGLSGSKADALLPSRLMAGAHEPEITSTALAPSGCESFIRRPGDLRNGANHLNFHLRAFAFITKAPTGPDH
jgi:hypothetical protein